jgi:hypothetical protein
MPEVLVFGDKYWISYRQYCVLLLGLRHCTAEEEHSGFLQVTVW